MQQRPHHFRVPDAIPDFWQIVQLIALQLTDWLALATVDPTPTNKRTKIGRAEMRIVLVIVLSLRNVWTRCNGLSGSAGDSEGGLGCAFSQFKQSGQASIGTRSTPHPFR